TPIAPARVAPRRENAGLFVGVAVGAAVFLILGGIGAAFMLLAVDFARAPARSRLGQPGPPPPIFPQWGIDRGGPGDAPAGPEPLARSRPQPKPLADVRIPDSREVRAPRAGAPVAAADGFAVTPVQFDDPTGITDLWWSADADGF